MNLKEAKEYLAKNGFTVQPVNESCGTSHNGHGIPDDPSVYAAWRSAASKPAKPAQQPKTISGDTIGDLINELIAHLPADKRKLIQNVADGGRISLNDLQSIIGYLYNGLGN